MKCWIGWASVDIGNEMGKNVSRERAITALVTHPTIKAAALACGVAEKTLHAWLKDPDFAARLKTAQEGITKAAIRAVILRTQRAVEVLDDIMSNDKNHAQSRAYAARTLLEFSMKAIEYADIMPRLEALEGR